MRQMLCATSGLCALLGASTAAADETLPPPPPTPSSLPPLPQRAADGSEYLPPPEAALEHEPPVLFDVGLRAAFASASGDFVDGASFSNPPPSTALPSVSSALPMTFDVGARIERYLYVGLATQYAPVFTGCLDAAQGATISCAGHDERLSLQIRLHAASSSVANPWVGIGFGYEWLTTTASGSNASTGTTLELSQTFRGWNFVDLSAGVDLHLSRSFTLGPFLELTSGSYAHVSGDLRVNQASSAGANDIARTSSHQWLAIGIRGAFLVGASDH